MCFLVGSDRIPDDLTGRTCYQLLQSLIKSNLQVIAYFSQYFFTLGGGKFIRANIFCLVSLSPDAIKSLTGISSVGSSTSSFFCTTSVVVCGGDNDGLGLYLCKCSDFGLSAADFQTLGIQSFDCRQSDFQLGDRPSSCCSFSKSIVRKCCPWASACRAAVGYSPHRVL